MNPKSDGCVFCEAPFHLIYTYSLYHFSVLGKKNNDVIMSPQRGIFGLHVGIPQAIKWGIK